jgi:hypothetical protein
MPLYCFFNEETGEYKDVFFHMNDEKRYVDENGYEWKREFISPNAQIDGNIDPFSENAFVNKTNKNDTLGSLYDRAAEMSEKRAKMSVTGRDPLKDKKLEDYSKKRHGLKHKQDPKTTQF